MNLRAANALWFILFPLCLWGADAPPLPEDFLVNIPQNVQELDEGQFWRSFINMLASLGLIVALILIAGWFFKRVLHTRIEQLNTTSAIKIVDRRTLTPKTTIYLLNIDGKQLAIAESINGITALGNIRTTQSDVDFEEVLDPSRPQTR